MREERQRQQQSGVNDQDRGKTRGGGGRGGEESRASKLRTVRRGIDLCVVDVIENHLYVESRGFTPVLKPTAVETWTVPTAEASKHNPAWRNSRSMAITLDVYRYSQVC